MEDSASLGGLLVEIITEIFATFAIATAGEADTDTLASISKTCRMFQRIVEPLLYRNTQVYYNQEHAPSPKRMDGIIGGQKLLRTLLERPQLGEYIRTFRVCNTGEKDYIPDIPNMTFAHDIFMHTSRVESIDILDILARDEWELSCWLLGHRIARTNPFGNLKELAVSIEGPNVSELLFIFQLPALEVAQFKIDQPYGHYPPLVLAKWQDTRSRIKQLSIIDMNINNLSMGTANAHDMFRVLANACPMLALPTIPYRPARIPSRQRLPRGNPSAYTTADQWRPPPLRALEQGRSILHEPVTVPTQHHKHLEAGRSEG